MNELNYDKLIVMDLETTGVDPTKDSIIQIAALAVDSGEYFEAKIKFDRTPDMEEALSINSYDEKIWSEEDIELSGALLLFNDFLRRNACVDKVSKAGKPYSVPVFAGYNVAFDFSFLKNAYQKTGVPLFCENRTYDIMQLAMWKLPNMVSYSLQNMAIHFGIDVENAHDALDDCYTTVEVAKKLLELPDNNCRLPKWTSNTY